LVQICTKVLPVIDSEGSDSAIFDNALEMFRPRGTITAARDDDDGAGAVDW
jgi:glutamate synthase domain-containing protein 1